MSKHLVNELAKVDIGLRTHSDHAPIYATWTDNTGYPRQFRW